MSSIMYKIKSLQPLLIFFIFEPPYLALRVWKQKNPIWPPGGHFESDLAENQ